MIDHRLTEREWAEEWKHVNNVSVQRGARRLPGLRPARGALGLRGDKLPVRPALYLPGPSAPQNLRISAPMEQLCLWEKGGLGRWDPFHSVFRVIPPLLPLWDGAPAGVVPRAALAHLLSPGRAPLGALKERPQMENPAVTPHPRPGAQAAGGSFHTMALSALWRALVAGGLAQAQGVGEVPWPSPAEQPPSPTRSLPPPARPQLLNCIMDMAEKTRRSLTVLRQCQEADREELSHWVRRCSDSEDAKKRPAPAPARALNSSPGAQGSPLGACEGAPRGAGLHGSGVEDGDQHRRSGTAV